MAGLSARLVADDGATYFYGKLYRSRGQNRRVTRGETIAFAHTQVLLAKQAAPPAELPKATYGVLPMAAAPTELTPEQLAANRRDFLDVVLVLGGAAGAIVIVVVARDVWKDRARKKRRRT